MDREGQVEDSKNLIMFSFYINSFELELIFMPHLGNILHFFASPWPPLIHSFTSYNFSLFTTPVIHVTFTFCPNPFSAQQQV